MPRGRDKTGEVYGYLTVLSQNTDKNPEDEQRYWNCKCVCGTIIVLSTSNLHRKNKSGKSCGCKNKKYVKHGLAGNRFYNIWRDIKKRCYNKNCRAYKWYGARGITLYEPWINDPVSFVDYVSKLENYDDEFTLDRIDNYKGYEPGNLRWASHATQAQNQRNNKLIFEDVRDIRELAKYISRKEIANIYKIHLSTVHLILKNKHWIEYE